MPLMLADADAAMPPPTIDAIDAFDARGKMPRYYADAAIAAEGALHRDMAKNECAMP